MSDAMTVRPRLKWVRPVCWGLAAILLLAPLVAMGVAPESGVNWTISDFAVAAIMIGTVGLLTEFAVRSSTDWAYRFGALIGIATGFLLIWINLAVGYIGDGDSATNDAFLAIPVLALVASALVRFGSRTMSLIMTAAAAAHAVVGIAGFPQDPKTGPITAVFTGLWLASAWGFRRSARRQRG